MTEQAGKPRKTIEEALAQRVEARRDAAFAGAEALHELGAVDRARGRVTDLFSLASPRHPVCHQEQPHVPGVLSQ